MNHRRITMVVVIAVVAGGCGESKSDKAMSQVCSARADISKQLESLKAITPATATTSAITDSLKAVRDDLTTIADAQNDLSEDRQQEVQQANEAFTAQVRTTLRDLGTTVSAENASAQLKSSFEQLRATYAATFGKIECP
jgi:Tfp pilus assembly protein PilP